MSIQAVAWVLEHSQSKGAARLVMISIANHADDSGQAWPSAKTIGREANINLDTVKRTLSDLVKTGELARVINAAPDSRMRPDRRPNLYQLAVFSALITGGTFTPSRETPGRRTPPTGGTSTSERGGQDAPPNHQYFNHHVNRALFEQFFRSYPRPTAKPAAQDAWVEAVTRADAQTIIAAANAYRLSQPEVRFVPYPARWLGDDRWVEWAPRRARPPCDRCSGKGVVPALGPDGEPTFDTWVRCGCMEQAG